MAWLSGWKNRIEIKIEDYANDIGGAVTWFPVTIFLKDANGDSTKVFEEVGANYRKIAITKADGVTELKGEIENWSYNAGTPANSVAKIHTSKTGWVINANTSIFLYYDNEHADNDNINVIGTAAGFAVWNNEYGTVQHKKDNTTSTVLDSTSNGNNGTKKAANEPLEVVSGVGKAQHYDGEDDYIGLTDDSFESDSLGTIEAIINRDVAARDGDIIFSSSELGTTNLLRFYIFEDSGYNLLAQHAKVGAGEHNDVIYGDTVLGTTEHHVALVSTGTAWILYVDGVAEGLSTLVGSNTGDWFAELAAGTHKNRIGSITYAAIPATFTMDGIIDEFRYSSVVRSAEWTKGTSNTLLDTLFTYGGAEATFEYVGTGTFAYSGTAIIIIGFTYAGSGNFVTSGSGICYYEKSDWEYIGSGTYNFSGVGLYSLGLFYLGIGEFVYSGSATQIHTRYYLYAGSGIFTYLGKAVHRWGDWSEIAKGTSDFTGVEKKGSNWSKIDKEKGDWRKTIKL